MVVDNLQDGEVVTEADFIVVDVVGGRNLEAAGTEVHLHVIVLDDGDLPVNQGDEHLLAIEPEVAFVLGVHADGGIGHDGLRTGGGNYQELVRGIAVAVRDEVAEMVEMALGVLVDYLIVRNGGEGHGIPVNHAYALVNPAFLVEIDESVDDGFRELRLHSEACAVPVAGTAKLSELLQDNAAVLFLPLPGMTQELFPADVFLGDALGLELGNHLAFSSYGSVVRARNPAGVLAVHAGLADEDIVKGIVQYMPHVQDSCHIGRRYHYGIRLFIVGFAVEAFMGKPPGIPLVFHILCTVLRC